MKPDQPSALRLLRMPILVLALVSLLAGAALFGSYSLKQARHDELEGLRQGVSLAREQFDQARRQVREQAAYATSFDSLVLSGLTAGEDRLEWVEEVRAFQQRRGLARVDYELAPRQELSAPDAYQLGNYMFSGTRVDISAQLLHEGDMLALLQMFRVRYQGMVVPQRCTLDRMSSMALDDPLHPRVGLDCRLIWLSLETRANNVSQQ